MAADVVHCAPAQVIGCIAVVSAAKATTARPCSPGSARDATAAAAAFGSGIIRSIRGIVCVPNDAISFWGEAMVIVGNVNSVSVACQFPNRRNIGTRLMRYGD